MLFHDIIHDAIQNVSTAIYAVRNCFIRPAAESSETDECRQQEEEFWNSSVGREISARIESELLREHCSC